VNGGKIIARNKLTMEYGVHEEPYREVVEEEGSVEHAP